MLNVSNTDLFCSKHTFIRSVVILIIVLSSYPFFAHQVATYFYILVLGVIYGRQIQRDFPYQKNGVNTCSYSGLYMYMYYIFTSEKISTFSAMVRNSFEATLLPS